MPRKHGNSLLELTDRTKRRNAAETRFKAYGIAAITAGLIMLLVLVTTIVGKGTGAFQQTFVTLNVELLEAKLDKKGKFVEDAALGVIYSSYELMIKEGLVEKREKGAQIKKIKLTKKQVE